MQTSHAVSMTGRYVNALCYIVTGITLFVLAGSKSGDGWAVVFGLASLGYGLYVGFTRRSYWVSTYTYIIPIVLIALAAAK